MLYLGYVANRILINVVSLEAYDVDLRFLLEYSCIIKKPIVSGKIGSLDAVTPSTEQPPPEAPPEILPRPPSVLPSAGFKLRSISSLF